MNKIDELLNGYDIVKTCNSGMEYRHSRTNKSSKPGIVSKQWIVQNLSDEEISELMIGEIIGVTIKKGKGYSYHDLERVRNDDPIRRLIKAKDLNTYNHFRLPKQRKNRYSTDIRTLDNKEHKGKLLICYCDHNLRCRQMILDPEDDVLVFIPWT